VDPRICATLQTVDTQYKRSNLKIADLAQSVNLSVSRFTHLFTAEVGMSPARYLRSVRLEAATTLLGQSFLTVKEVAVAVGMNSTGSLDRAYKRLSGRTPSAVRRTPASDSLLQPEFNLSPLMNRASLTERETARRKPLAKHPLGARPSAMAK